MPGKWGLHTFYSRDAHLAKLLPNTKILTRASLRELLNRFGSVYVKPNMEHMGKGIIKVWKTAGAFRIVKVKGRQQPLKTEQELVNRVMTMAQGKPHIVQQAIPLAQIKGRNYDIRVMMMRDGNDRWQYSGMLAKVAGPTSVITNVLRGGGYAVSVREALRSSLPAKINKAQLERDLIARSHAICRRFNRYKYSSQIGIDFGVDRNGKLWLIEVNFDFPSHELFNRLPDKTWYRLIKRRHAEYLRMKKNKRTRKAG